MEVVRTHGVLCTGTHAPTPPRINNVKGEKRAGWEVAERVKRLRSQTGLSQETVEYKR